MRTIHPFVGCALFIVGIGSAAATSAGTQDLGSSPQTSLDSGSASGGNTGGGDVLGLSRDCPQAGSGGNSANSAHNSNDQSGGGAAAPLPSRRPHLGWQSLLPGSIQ